MNMIEKVARAICEANGYDPDGPTSDVYVEGDPVAGVPWAGYRKEARAALEAMREPTEAMRRALADSSVLEGAHHGTGEACWEAGIDAALAGDPT